MPAPKREAEGTTQTCLDCGQAQRRDLWPDSQHRQQTAPGLPTPASPRNRPHSHLIPETSPRNAAGLPNPLWGRSRCAPAACGRRGSQPGLAGSGSHSQTRRRAAVAPVGETGRNPGPAEDPRGGRQGGCGSAAVDVGKPALPETRRTSTSRLNAEASSAWLPDITAAPGRLLSCLCRVAAGTRRASQSADARSRRGPASRDRGHARRPPPPPDTRVAGPLLVRGATPDAPRALLPSTRGGTEKGQSHATEGQATPDASRAPGPICLGPSSPGHPVSEPGAEAAVPGLLTPGGGRHLGARRPRCPASWSSAYPGVHPPKKGPEKRATWEATRG